MRITVDLIKQRNAEFLLFPDGQPHVILSNVVEGDKVDVECRLNNSLAVLQLLEVANAIENLRAKKCTLKIYYLMGARSDRSMQNGDSIDLKVIAKLINSCEFDKVEILDVHSETATQLINNAVNISNQQLVETYQKKEAILICPDAGASKKIKDYFAWNPNLTEVVYCIKQRVLSTGKLTLQVINPEFAQYRNCVIIDDICDGGATFLAIAKQLEPFKVKHLTLMVTHGIFSKGLQKLQDAFDEIITTDSFKYQNPENKLTVLQLAEKYEH